MVNRILSAEAQLAIHTETQRHIKRYAAVLGIPTVAAILIGGFWVFSAFGGVAVDAAKKRTDQFLSNEIAGINVRIESAEKRNIELRSVSDNLLGKSDFIEDEIQEALEKLNKVRDLISALEDDNQVIRAGKLLENMRESENSVDILSRVKKAESGLDSVKLSLSDTAWPKGSYCIFKSGSCPSGFTPRSAAMLGIWTYRGSDQKYIVEGGIGDTVIRWHGGEDRLRGAPDWHGELLLHGCCKSN